MNQDWRYKNRIKKKKQNLLLFQLTVEKKQWRQQLIANNYNTHYNEDGNRKI